MNIDPRILPTVLIVINVVAAAVYLMDGGINEWRRAVYWLSAATLTYVVTW